MTLSQFITAHTTRGECQCGRCIDRGTKPEPAGHTADLVFFKVAASGNPDKSEFIRLAKEHRGEFCDCDPFDGKEHGYMELGGWIGDQGLAMLFMGLGSLLGVFTLITPRMLLGDKPEMKGLVMQMAESGMLTVAALAAPTPAQPEDAR